jgi:hypothetical protein
VSDQDRKAAIEAALGGADFKNMTPLKDLIGEKLFISGYTASVSSLGEFIIIAAVKEDGTELQVRTSSQVVWDQLKRLEMAELLPGTFTTVKKASQKPGQYLFSLESAE